MAVTERLEPQLLQVTKYNLFSPLLSSVSGLRQVLQVTYSTIVLLVQRNTCATSSNCKLTDVSAQNVLDLLLLETTLDDKAPRAVDGAGGTHFREHVLDDMLWLPVHTFADIGDVGEDRLLVSFTEDLRGRDGVPLAGGREEGRVRSV